MALGYVLAPGFYEWRGECLVRLRDDFRKSAVLIGTSAPGSDDDIVPWGSAFLVGAPDIGITYLVTAAHVVSDKMDAPFDVRFNVRGGGARNHKEEYPDWITHLSDNTVDVAVHEIAVPDWADVSHVPMVPNLAVGDRLRKKDIGPGCETYTVGLWKFMHGKRRNQTFVYTGHIGLMPEDEKVPVKPWLRKHGPDSIDVDAYLVESEPLDGASGAPVFVRRTLDTPITPTRIKRGSGPALEAHLEGSVWLLGLQSDAFVGRAGKDYEVLAGKIVPRGVNVVVPVERIMEVLDHPKLKASREAAKKADVAASTPVKTGQEPSTKDENPQHEEDFNRLLDAAVKGRRSGG